MFNECELEKKNNNMLCKSFSQFHLYWIKTAYYLAEKNKKHIQK